MVLKSFIVTLCVLYTLQFSDTNYYESNIKRTNKVLSKVWEDKEVELKEVQIPSSMLEKLSIKNIELYTVKESNDNIAYAYFTDAPSKIDKFTYMIIFDLNLKIMYTEVLKYRENYGAEICSKRFLRQFEGKSNGIDLEFDEDIDGVSGATISSKSITISVKKASKNIVKLKTNHLI